LIPDLVLIPRSESGYSVTQICGFLRISRDSYYKSKGRLMRITNDDRKALDIVMSRRRILPREGVRKLYKAIKAELDAKRIKIGRDKLFDLLRTNQLLVKPKKAYHRTTNSNHRFYTHKNLIKDFVPTAANQVWVSDITYIRTLRGFCFLALITDAFSRKIVGYDLSNSLELSGSIRALKMALKKLPRNHRLIHHSDRGSQYCSHQYVKLLKKKEIRISMTQENHCYENAIAERVNGILKDEFYLDSCFIDKYYARKCARDAINNYNTYRLHLSLNYKTPNQVHKMVA
jgi:transposase InsO family protein